MVRYSFLLLSLVTGLCPAEQDPTAPLGWQQPVQSKSQPKKTLTYAVPKLQSIVCEQSQTCSAVLNGRVVSKGSVVNGYTVVKINNEFVFLRRGNGQWKLSLFSMDVKY